MVTLYSLETIFESKTDPK